MILHFLSGGVVAMTGILMFQFFSKIDATNRKKVIWSALIFTLFIGLLWEWFEIFFDITFFSDGFEYWSDTISDVILDMLGGFLGMKYSFYILNKYGK